MSNEFKVGDRVRVRGQHPDGVERAVADVIGDLVISRRTHNSVFGDSPSVREHQGRAVNLELDPRFHPSPQPVPESFRKVFCASWTAPPIKTEPVFTELANARMRVLDAACRWSNGHGTITDLTDSVSDVIREAKAEAIAEREVKPRRPIEVGDVVTLKSNGEQCVVFGVNYPWLALHVKDDASRAVLTTRSKVER